LETLQYELGVLNDTGKSALEQLQLQLAEAKKQLEQDLEIAAKEGIANDNIAEILKGLPAELAAMLSSALTATLGTMLQTIANGLFSQQQLAGITAKTASGAQTVKTSSGIVDYAAKQAADMINSGYSGGYNTSTATPMTALEQQIASIYSSVLGRDAEVSGLQYWAGTGLSATEIAAAIGSSHEATVRNTFGSDAQKQMQSLVSDYLGILPAFSSGANRIPQDMFAQIHKDEAIIPAKFNPWAGGSMPTVASSENSELIEQLIQEVQMLRYETRATATNTAKMTKQLDRASGENDVLRVEVVA